MKKLGIVICSVIVFTITYFLTTADSAFSMEPSIIVRNPITSGEIKALVIRVGYNDYPLNDSNKYYNIASNDFIKSAFVNDSDANLPYSGITEYIEKSSFGKMSISLGDIIDIQMDKDLEFYLNYDGTDSKIIDYDIFTDFSEYSGPYYKTDEFEKKLLQNINIDDYDSNNDGIIDALYIFDTSDYRFNTSGNATLSLSSDSTISQGRVWLPLCYNSDLKQLTKNLIHETGHLLLDLEDYYLLNGFDTYHYPNHSVENIMATGYSDFDAVAKWHMGWLNDDNIIRLYPINNETATVSLSPSDSDSDQGKKLAIINLSDYIHLDDIDEGWEVYYNIAIEYISGSNNNNFTNLTKPKGFRFYLIEGEHGEKDITGNYSHITRAFKTGKYDPDFLQHISYQVLNEEDIVENLFDLGIDIIDIKTGDNPSFTFSYNKKENIDLPTTDLYSLADYSSLFGQIARLSDDFIDIDFIPAFIPDDYFDKYTEESLTILKDALYAQYDRYKLPEQYIVDQNTARLKAAIDGLELKENKTVQDTETSQNSKDTTVPEKALSVNTNYNSIQQPNITSTINDNNNYFDSSNNTTAEPVKSDLSVKRSESYRTTAPKTGITENRLIFHLATLAIALTTLCIIVHRKFIK